MRLVEVTGSAGSVIAAVCFVLLEAAISKLAADLAACCWLLDMAANGSIHAPAFSSRHVVSL